MPTVGTYDFSNYYGVDPWGDITLNEREWYDPILREIYTRNSVYSQHVTMKVDLNGPRARTIYFNDLIPPRPNIAPIGNRTMEATRLYSDSFQRAVTTRRYGNGMALHRESEMFSYWKRMGGGTGYGLLPIIQQQMGQVVVDHLDLLARNKFFSTPNRLMGNDNVSGFGAIDDDDIASTDLVDAIWLGMRSRKVPNAALPVGFPVGNEILCITSAGFVHDLKREIGTSGSLAFVDAHKYAAPTPLFTGELGMWRGVRFIENEMAVLKNCGEIYAQTTITAAVQPGDGAPGPNEAVEGTRYVGQPDATHYISVNDTTGFYAGDEVTIHLERHTSDTLAAYDGKGVLNGVVFDDPMAQTVEIHRVDAGNKRLYLKEPYMMTKDNGKGLETDLGGGVYGYVTRGRHIHSALFLTQSRNGLVAGVAQPPTFYTPIPTDDYESMYRIAYDMYIEYAQWEIRVFEVWYGSAANKVFGSIFYGDRHE